MNQQITDIASLVFWTNVRNKTFKVTRNIVLKRQFEELWVKAIVPHYLKKLNLDVDPSNIESTKEWIYEKVNEFMYDSTLNEQNILGTIYLDDTIECKSPDFDEFTLLENLQQAYTEYEPIELSKFQKIGTLLLRTPLPSVPIHRAPLLLLPKDVNFISLYSFAISFMKIEGAKVESYTAKPFSPHAKK